MPSSGRKPTAAALAARASRSGGGLEVGSGFGLGVGGGVLTTAMVVGGVAAMAGGGAMVGGVVSAMAAGDAGLAPSRPTTKAVATPMATASTLPAATRRIWDGRIA